jgi:phospholipid transport system transporter-binding protein
MKKTADITLQDNRLLISGDLHFSNVMSVYKKSLQQSQQCPELVFDFSQLKSSDSAGLALIIEWIKLSREVNKPIRFTHLSDHIMSLAKAAGLADMFNGTAATKN